MTAAVAPTGAWKIEIVRRSDRHRFLVLPKRWIVECTIRWISRNRRLPAACILAWPMLRRNQRARAQQPHLNAKQQL